MPNLANILKHEITRIARKQVRSEFEGTKHGSVALRKQVAALRRRIDSLERELARRPKQVNKSSPSQEQRTQPALRFRSTGLRAHRERLGLSAREVGQLLGASTLSIYKWEAGKARPRDKHLEAIAMLRKMGKREAAAKLAELS